MGVREGFGRDGVGASAAIEGLGLGTSASAASARGVSAVMAKMETNYSPCSRLQV